MSNYNVIIPHYSVMLADGLAKIIQDNYNFKNKISLELLTATMNDIYKVTSGSNTYYVKIPRHDRFWPFTRESYQFEMELLTYLRKQNFDVSHPITLKTKDYLGILNAPEGIRYYAMYTEANGTEIDLTDTSQSKLAGKHLARFHGLTDKFTSNSQPINWDFELLIDYGMNKLKSIIDVELNDDINYISKKAYELIHTFKQNITGKGEHYWGVIHGDYAPKNIRIHDGVISSFDYEYCGLSYRIFDFAFIIQKTHINNLKNKYFQSFLDGYQEIRQLSEEEISMLPVIARLALISRMTVSTGFYYLVGAQWFDTKIRNDIRILKKVL